MKKKLLKKESLYSILSALILGAFMVIAISSIFNQVSNTEYLGDGVYKTTYENVLTDIKIYKTGKQNEYGQWQGPIKTESVRASDGHVIAVEEVNYVNGDKHGMSTYTRFSYGGDVLTLCYNMGERVPCEKSTKSVSNANTAYYILQSKYALYQNLLNDCGFDDANLETFFETFEAKLAENSFGIDELASKLTNLTITTSIQKNRWKNHLTA